MYGKNLNPPRTRYQAASFFHRPMLYIHFLWMRREEIYVERLVVKEKLKA